MSDETSKSGDGGPSDPIPFMQRLLDNPFLLLALGIAVPALLYMVWGVMEVISIPLAD